MIIPITADQDTAGPMAKTVTDAAILLGAMEGASPDPNDPATLLGGGVSLWRTTNAKASTPGWSANVV